MRRVSRSRKRRKGGLAAGIILLALAAAAVPLGYYGHRLWPQIGTGRLDISQPDQTSDDTDTIPHPSSRVARLVDDEAAILDNEQTQRLAQLHASLLNKHDIDLRIVTVEGVDPIDRATLERYVALRAGALSKKHRGVLLLVDALSHLARMRLGPELQQTFPQSFVTFVETELLLYYFQHDRLAKGVIVATKWIQKRADDAAAQRPFIRPTDFDPRKPLPLPGATTGPHKRASEAQPPASHVTPSRTSPIATFQRYISALERGDARPALPIYTKESRRYLATQLPSKAQLGAVVQTYARCPAPQIRRKSDLAVLRFPKHKRRCAPYFLRREGGAWRLDLATMSRVVQYNQRGQWHLARGAEHPYSFAFRDWRFDYYGFPR